MVGGQIRRNLASSRAVAGPPRKRSPLTVLLARPWEAWLDTVWNSVDRDRVAQAGGATVAAQWMLRLGGRVQLADRKWISDYNSLPNSPAIRVSSLARLANEYGRADQAAVWCLLAHFVC